MRRRATTVLIGAILAVAVPRAGLGYSGGIVELEASQIHGGGGAVNGCRCHSSALRPPRTPTQVFVTGLPEAWVGDATYPIRVWVLGASVPSTSGQPDGSAFAGFSLLVTDGELAAADSSARVVKTTECALMEKQDEENVFAGAPPLCKGSTCAVEIDVDGRCGVFDPSNPYCRTCDLTNGSVPCRACDGATALAWEATHTAHESGVSLDPALDPFTIPRTDGNNQFFWDLVWTAPPAGSGKVRINLAGNVANGNGFNDSGDIWNFGERIYLCEAGESCAADDPGAGHH